MTEIAPEMAEKVLAADLRNKIKSIGEGGQLKTVDREIFECRIIEGISIEALRQRRQSALLRKWTNAGRLNKEEKGEIAHFMPDPPSDPGAGGKVIAERYSKPISEYAPIVGYDVRTLRNWLKRGRARTPPDLPPLDAPEDLANWWGRVMKHRVPDQLLKLAGREAKPAPVTQADPLRSEASAAAPVSPPPSSLGTGFAAALERARDNERLSADKLREVQLSAAPDSGAIEMRQRAWERSFEALRKAEKDAEEILLAHGEVVRWAEVERVQAEKLGVLNQTIRSLLVRVFTRVPVPSELAHALEAAFQLEVDKAYTHLASNNFSQVPPPEVREDLKLAA